MNILVINNGSATLKLDVLEVFPADGQTRRMAQARVEQFGSTASVSFSAADGRALKATRTVPDHTAALHLFLDWLRRPPREINNPTTSHDVSASISRGENATALDIAAVGHRVVHGGSKFSASTLLTPEALAVEMFCYRVSKYIGAYLAALGGAQAVVFGGGIGENSPPIRARICERLAWFGLHLDAAKNAAAVGLEARITNDTGRLQAWVVGVDESVLVAEQTALVIENNTQPRPISKA